MSNIKFKALCQVCAGRGWNPTNIHYCCSGQDCGYYGQEQCDQDDCTACNATGWSDLSEEKEAA